MGQETSEEQAATSSEAAASRIRIHVPARHNPRLQKVMETVQADEELYALWTCQNVTAVQRLGMSDHGPVHVQIVANTALRLLRLLLAAGVEPGIVKDHGLSSDDAEVVVVLASLLHDVGMSIHRANHEEYSLIIADRKLPQLLAAAYPDAATRAILQSEVLHAIISHRRDGKPLTLEAGVVRVADALDMAQGRSRIPFEQGAVNIHSVSALAIARVEIGAGEEKPVRVFISMRNSAGIFQVDSLFKEKLQGSGLEPYVEVVAALEEESETTLVQSYVL
ncbi:MAG: HD domain-containing protein [Caldilineae bacterium]|nr:MAG: HD domain-containing protein [Caldilineae bacterium]